MLTGIVDFGGIEECSIRVEEGGFARPSSGLVVKGYRIAATNVRDEASN